MNHFKILNYLIMNGLVLSIGATHLRAQELATRNQAHVYTQDTQNIDDTKWFSKEIMREKTFDGLRSVEPEDVKQFEMLLIATIAEIEKLENKITVEELQNRWAKLDWQLTRSPSGNIFVVREHLDHQHGRGVYAFRCGHRSRIILQAPHRFNDLMTGSIAIRLFQEQAVSAIALNTIHRSEIDLSHTNLHFINSFTSAVIKARHDIAILQIHGFTNDGKTGAAKSANVIVSDTTNFPGRSARKSAAELKATFGADHTRLFPVDIRTLGGTTNSQAKLAHSLGCPDFLHIELNRTFRNKLNADASVRATFFASMTAGISK